MLSWRVAQCRGDLGLLGVQKPDGFADPVGAGFHPFGTSSDRLDAARRLSLYGLRRGEVLGLRWPDIDLRTSTLTVNQARVLVEYRVRIEEPKSRNGKRTLPIAAVITVMCLWALVFVPFLWLALVRRRARDWVVLAAYLAAEAALVYIIASGFQPSGAYGDGSAIAAGLLVIAPVHAWVAFSPAAGMTSWHDARATTAAGQHPVPVMDAVAPQDLQ